MTQRAVALGFFDGIHLGHAALLQKVKERSEEYSFSPAVITFDTHPDTLVHGTEVPLINSAAEREDLIRRLYGIDTTIFLHFNRTMMCMPWQDFISSIVDEMNIRSVVVGHDFCFGYRGEGKPDRLKNWCEEHGVFCDVIPAVCVDGRIVSSTEIRALLADGKLEEANRLLGHPHTLSDMVRPGFHLGKKLGSPTINMVFPHGIVIPKHGVYATKVYLDDGSVHNAVTNVGCRPTVSDSGRVSVESHLLEYDGDLYGHRVRVDFHHFQRPEKKFSSELELARQIQLDAEDAKTWFEQRNLI